MNYETVGNCQVQGLNELYLKYFKYRTFGTFVEIGAYDGISFSNTYGLARAGWKGLYAEPVKEFYEICKENLKEFNVEVKQTALGNRVGSIRMHIAGTVSTYEQFHIDAPVWKSHYNPNAVQDVPLTTLDLFLEENKINPWFDLLVIDTEGSEMKVLEGFTLDRWYPKMVIVEAEEHSPFKELTVLAPQINEFFGEYEKVYSDEINNIYIRNS